MARAFGIVEVNPIRIGSRWPGSERGPEGMILVHRNSGRSNMKNNMKKNIIVAIIGLMSADMALAGSGTADADLAKGFASPPGEARPWVYWLALSGNLTKEGITADFEAMARVGIGGVIHGSGSGRAERESRFRGPAVDGIVLPRLPRGEAARARNQHEQRRRVVRQRRAVDHAGTLHAEGGLEGNRGRRRQEVDRCRCRSPRPCADTTATSPCWRCPHPEGNERIPNSGNKALFAPGHLPPLPADVSRDPGASVIPRGKIVDLTGKKKWDVPPGKWLVMRFGCTTTGKDNHPGARSGARLGMRQVQQGGHRAALQESDRQAGREEQAAVRQGQGVCLDPH